VTDQRGQIRILVADEQSLFREAVRVILSAEEDLLVVSDAKEGLEAVEEAVRTRPDVVLLDWNLPNCDGLRATALIKERAPEARVVVIGDSADQRVLIDALRAGASGYLTREMPLADLIEATRAVHRGDTLVPHRMLGPLLLYLIRRRTEQDEALRRIGRLTRREREILAQLVDGADNGGIARALVISPETARTHIQSVLAKLGVHSRLEAVAFVVQNGLLDELTGAER